MSGPLSTPPRTASASASPRELRVVDLGRRPYREILELQRRLARARLGAENDHDLLLFVEHDPVITLGRGADPAHVVTPAAALAERGVEIVEIERGGDVTYHGPGQLVGYPILDLNAHRRDLHWYLRRLEETLLRTLAELELPACRVEGYTGAWTGELPAYVDEDGFPTVAAQAAARPVREGRLRKVASIGVHASRWITWHGFALNVSEEPLAQFPGIVPCGIESVRMTSLHREGARVSLADAADAVLRGFNVALPDLRPRWTDETRLAD